MICTGCGNIQFQAVVGPEVEGLCEHCREEMARDQYYDQKLHEMLDEGRTIRGRHV
jgi:hypothetical protein